MGLDQQRDGALLGYLQGIFPSYIAYSQAVVHLFQCFNRVVMTGKLKIENGRS